MQILPSLFTCPICRKPLLRMENSYRCWSGHSYDLSAAGYIHLLPANKMHSKNPGDDKAMVAAHTAFLDAGYYESLRRALCSIAADLCAGKEDCTLFDSGCGEGYYTFGIHNTLRQSGVAVRTAGIDISKHALRKAARRLPEGEFAVASAYDLPLMDESVDLLYNVFSPMAREEFLRVLHPGGHLIYVVPSARHLWEMKGLLYETPYENDASRADYEGFAHVGTRTVRETICLTENAHIMALFGMTPYAHKTPKGGIERLQALETLETTIGFDVHIYQKQA